MKKKLLIVNKAAFGYHTDSYKHCQYLRNDFDITYFCFENRERRMSMEGINVISVPLTGNYIQRAFRFFKAMKKLLAGRSFDIAMVVNFDACFLSFFLVRSSHFLLDIRTGSVAIQPVKRFFQNLKTRLNLLFFKNVSIISDGLAAKFRLKKYLLLPLGADPISMKNKSFDTLSLLYVGTLSGRQIQLTIEGFATYTRHFKSSRVAEYNIIGFGSAEEESLIRECIRSLGLTDSVFFHGRIPHQDLGPYFDAGNVGVSFVPMTSYYEFQPPTKTFEYLLSGMPCIATGTHANKELIRDSNGIICTDDAGSFARSLQQLERRVDTYRSEAIRADSMHHSWEFIAEHFLLPYLHRL